uniref:BPI2 domain-containing protein n=1 Tax=Parastrongyloides trichosuri TaxID=131310 RepID=A0A0N4ZX41_PARTI
MIFRNLYLLSLFYLIFSNEDLNPTLIGRVSNEGLNFVSKLGHKIVDYEIPKIEFPEIDLDIDAGPGKGKLYVDDLHIPSFETPKFKFILEPPRSIHWISQGGSIQAKGNIYVKYKVVIPISFSATIHINAQDIRTNYSLSLHHLDGRPQLDVNYCDTYIKSLTLSFGGGVIPWIVNLFKTPLAAAAENAIKNQFCDTLKSVLLSQINDLLVELPTHIELGRNFFIDYDYNHIPIVTSDYVQLDAYAIISIGEEKCPYEPMKMDTYDAPNDYMANFWASPAISNCFLYSVYKQQVLKFIINKDSGAALATLLKTSCGPYEICLGKFFSALQARYPNKYVDIVIRLDDKPSIVISKTNGIVFNGILSFDFSISPYKESDEVLARLVSVLNATIKPYIKNGAAKATIQDFDFVLKQEFSNIGNFSKKICEFLSNIIKPTLKKTLETLATQGFKIPMYQNFTIASTSAIVPIDNGIRFDLDLSYTKNFEKYLFKKLWNMKYLMSGF